MLVRVGYDIIFNLPNPASMILMLYTHPSRAADMIKRETLQVEPNIPVNEFIDGFGNRCARIAAPAGRLRLYNDAVVWDNGEPEPAFPDAAQHSIAELPPEVLRYLFASRYCEVDRLNDIAWNLFGATTPGWSRVEAICSWVHSHLRFDYKLARPTRTAYDAYVEKVGVCRDFTHLAITLCRCMNIPARYTTGYLGDICVPAAPFPMDFSASMEVYLGGRWHTFDPRHNERRVARILMATGCDAGDVALTTTFGPSRLDQFNIWTEEIQSADIKPLNPAPTEPAMATS